MNWFTNTVSSSIGRKYIMSITGLFLIVFLIAHLLGNFLLIKNDGGQAFNEYAHFMTSNPFIQIIRVLNFVFILMHIIYSIILTYLNKKARPISYRFKMNVSNSTWMSRNMGVLGLIILIFLLIHLRTFLYTMNFGDIPYVEYNGNYIKNLYVIVVKAFSKLWYTALYVFFMMALAFHLAHGFQSAFQSLGVSHSKLKSLIKITGWAFSILVPLLFAVIPVYIYLKYVVSF